MTPKDDVVYYLHFTAQMTILGDGETTCFVCGCWLDPDASQEQRTGLCFEDLHLYQKQIWRR